MEIILIRHGKTLGNLKKVYLGATDESLCEEGTAEVLEKVKSHKYHGAHAVYTSPLKRCVETLMLIYKGADYNISEGLAERNFGAFEYKSYEELKNLPEYISWIENAGEGAEGGCEDGKAYKARTIKAFTQIVSTHLDSEKIAIIAHGGTIMQIMQSVAGGSIYDYQVKNGDGYIVKLAKEDYLKNGKIINFSEL